ncbi:DUF11 domain-containing protein [Conexibacter arvalis]|uniref:DUF11 domain-containing protein n=1 Tax=Conexibacter arvalis TaxID=912552 RepID=A0A840IDH3_9ACTN|nr:DUF11 domain-containing protein [Conexibacter arvalis]MBB4662088.1 hypothetical protein [Conexibacter arvalis]
MGARGLAAAGAVTMAAALAALAPAAQGRTLGDAERPLGATTVRCRPVVADVVGHQVDEGSASWTVPNRSMLASWSTNVTASGPGESVSLVVLRRDGSELRIAAVDTATLPATPPAGGIATFGPTGSIVLEPGDRLGIAGSDGANCGWEKGAIEAGRQAAVWKAEPAIALGATVAPYVGPWSPSQLNLAAVVAESDVHVAATAGPANVIAGGLAQLSATVSNTGAVATPVTVRDSVPAGLTVETAVAGGGSCAVAGQQVTCEIASLAPGGSVPVVVLVTPAAPGSYGNTVTARPTLDREPSVSSASATLTVVPQPSGGGDDGRGGDDRSRGGDRTGENPPPAPRRCVVPALARTPLNVARGLLRQLDCRPGKVTKQRSKKIRKGAVISTKPGRGQYRAGSAVRIVVSSGKPPRKPLRRARARR